MMKIIYVVSLLVACSVCSAAQRGRPDDTATLEAGLIERGVRERACTKSLVGRGLTYLAVFSAGATTGLVPTYMAWEWSGRSLGPGCTTGAFPSALWWTTFGVANLALWSAGAAFAWSQRQEADTLAEDE